MTHEQWIAKACGVSVHTVRRWTELNKYPKYAQRIINHCKYGKVFKKGWENYEFNGNRLWNNETGSYIDKEDIELLWIIKQQLMMCQARQKIPEQLTLF